MRGLIRRAAGGGQRATSRLSFCARPKRLSSARTPPPSLWPSSERRFLAGVASDAVSATGVAAADGRRAEERRAAGFAGAEVPRITEGPVIGCLVGIQRGPRSPQIAPFTAAAVFPILSTALSGIKGLSSCPRFPAVSRADHRGPVAGEREAARRPSRRRRTSAAGVTVQFRVPDRRGGAPAAAAHSLRSAAAVSRRAAHRAGRSQERPPAARSLRPAASVVASWGGDVVERAQQPHQRYGGGETAAPPPPPSRIPSASTIHRTEVSRAPRATRIAVRGGQNTAAQAPSLAAGGGGSTW